MTTISVISDTHGWIHPKIVDFISNSDQVWHAGDIGNINFSELLPKNLIFKAVYGNIDDSATRTEYKKYLFFEVENFSVLMIHIGGYPNKYDKEALELIKQYKPKVFVCGHSHILKVIYDKKNEMLVINPGSAGKYGFHKSYTAIKFIIENNDIRDMQVLDIPKN